MASLRDIVVDARHPASLARFWVAALDGYRVAPYDEEELRRLAAQGIDDPEDDPSVLVEVGPGRPRFFFAQVPEGKVVKNRLHLDLSTTDHPAEVARLVSLGAVVVSEHEGWVQMRDPEGNEFCLLR
ncbi:VOC family protein [Kineococcus indalonis]|uniref:VOC family protein n=1 Tax=Kineococcus indalonis TaxID=2696566 RepID=UPI0014125483|nr:VOC family protein [Kineococcus indalonis]NAZ84545.1 VOC family protein [Kineococcus indalonis]